MNNYEDKFPELYQYLGGLFHQDWKDVFDWNNEKPSFEGVVRYFKVLNQECYKQDESASLKKFLLLNLSSDDVENILRKWNIAFRPAYINLTHKEWLERVLEILEAV
jgi:CdiI immunity protein